MSKLNLIKFSSIAVLAFFLNSCNKGNTEPEPEVIINKPTVTTTDVTAISQIKATGGGTVTNDGGSAVTDRGVCWGTSPIPTLSDSKISSGTGKGIFSSDMTGLSLGVKYYVRAYATNSKGTSYGDEKSFTTDATLAIGLAYAGGIIFYLDATKLHGLVCTDTNQASWNPWGCEKKKLVGPVRTAIGTGAQNTLDIISECNEGGCAADVCSKLVRNGYSDWFLPSQDELLLMYNNLKVKGLGKFPNDPFWSSTQAPYPLNTDSAIGISFFGGISGNWGKGNKSSVRAVRAF